MGESASEFAGVPALACCLLVSTRRWVQLQSCMVTKVICSARARMLRGRSKHRSGRISIDRNVTVMRPVSVVGGSARSQPARPEYRGARQFAEHGLTGHAMYGSWCVAVAWRRVVQRTLTRHEKQDDCRRSASIMASSAVTKKTHCHPCVSNYESGQLGAWERLLLTRRVHQTMRLRTGQHSLRVRWAHIRL